MQRLTGQRVSRLDEMVADVVAEPRYAGGVACGFREDAGIFPLDLELQPTAARA